MQQSINKGSSASKPYTFSIYFKKDALYDGDTEKTDAQKRSLEVMLHNLIVRYGIGNGLDVRALVPYAMK